MTTMGKRIHDKRVENNLTMEELGQKLGVKRQTVFKAESIEKSRLSAIFIL